MIVQAPDGATWRVGVVWEPRWAALALRYGGWRRRRKQQTNGGGGLPDLNGSGGGGGWFDLGDDILVGIAVIVGLVVFGALFWWLLLPLLLLLLDVVAVVVLMVVGVLSRVLFRRPWIVRATNGTGTDQVMLRVVGWRAARQARDEIAAKLRAGKSPVDILTGDATGDR
jgi:hypothetical protein